MNKKLVIVTTDMEIELVMFVNKEDFINVKKIISNVKEMYYGEEENPKLFEDILSEEMKKCGIDFEIVDYEEI